MASEVLQKPTYERVLGLGAVAYFLSALAGVAMLLGVKFVPDFQVPLDERFGTVDQQLMANAAYAAVSLISAIGLFRDALWGRVFFVVASAASGVVSTLLMNVPTTFLWVQLGLAAVFALLLFGPRPPRVDGRQMSIWALLFMMVFLGLSAACLTYVIGAAYVLDLPDFEDLVLAVVGALAGVAVVSFLIGWAIAGFRWIVGVVGWLLVASGALNLIMALSFATSLEGGGAELEEMRELVAQADFPTGMAAAAAVMVVGGLLALLSRRADFQRARAAEADTAETFS